MPLGVEPNPVSEKDEELLKQKMLETGRWLSVCLTRVQCWYAAEVATLSLLS